MDRFDLEEALSALYNTSDDIDTILHAYMDAPIRPTEDEMSNMLIGAKALHNARYQKMWEIFETLIKQGTITNKCCVTELNESPQGSPEITEQYQK